MDERPVVVARGRFYMEQREQGREREARKASAIQESEGPCPAALPMRENVAAASGGGR